MKSTRIAIAAAMVSILIAGVAQAGGRAHVTVLNAPKDVQAGKTIELTFAVNPEWPMAKNRKLEPTVKAVCGDQVVTLNAVALKAANQYRAVFTLPAAGEWVITVDSRYCETRMKPLVVTAAGEKSTRS
ncbi:MAG TPA: hypothetical protein VJY35_07770 [Candidatus Eisenbacteria bacterium]|nr:hypothetical protein [Candidatus Eisenbacteria bacterium]